MFCTLAMFRQSLGQNLLGELLLFSLFSAPGVMQFSLFSTQTLFSISFLSVSLCSVPFSLGKVFGKALARTCWEDSSQYWERADQQPDKTFVGYFLRFLHLISLPVWLIPFFCVAPCGPFKFFWFSPQQRFHFFQYHIE